MIARVEGRTASDLAWKCQVVRNLLSKEVTIVFFPWFQWTNADRRINVDQKGFVCGVAFLWGRQSKHYTDVNPHLCCHVASLSCNESIKKWERLWCCFCDGNNGRHFGWRLLNNSVVRTIAFWFLMFWFKSITEGVIILAKCSSMSAKFEKCSQWRIFCKNYDISLSVKNLKKHHIKC